MVARASLRKQKRIFTLTGAGFVVIALALALWAYPSFRLNGEPQLPQEQLQALRTSIAQRGVMTNILFREEERRNVAEDGRGRLLLFFIVEGEMPYGEYQNQIGRISDGQTVRAETTETIPMLWNRYDVLEVRYKTVGPDGGVISQPVEFPKP